LLSELGTGHGDLVIMKFSGRVAANTEAQFFFEKRSQRFHRIKA